MSSTCYLTEWSYEDGLLIGRVIKDSAQVSQPGEYIVVGTVTEVCETPKRVWFRTHTWTYIAEKKDKKA